MTPGATVVGVDVGGTTIKAARCTPDGMVLSRADRPTPGDAATLTDAVGNIAAGLADDTTVAVGVASAGVVADGVVRFAANLAWSDEPLRDRMADRLGLPITVVQDVNAAAAAETESLDAADVFFVAIGTGIAARHVVEGIVRAGATGAAGELGHIPVHPGGEPCACGQRGCLEVYASAAAIARRYSGRTGEPVDAAEVVRRVATDAAAATVWAEAVDALALALATATLLVDPGVIVIGGGLARAGDTLLVPLRAGLDAALAWRPPPPVRPAVLGADAGPIGAARLAARELADRPVGAPR